MDEVNPFQSPAIEVEVVSHDDAGLDLAEPYRYLFRNPNWLVNTLLMGAVYFIPIVGPIVLLGYEFEVAIALLRHPGQNYPDFDFNRFVNYLVRGIWPLLVVFTVSILIGFVLALAFGGVMLVLVLMNQNAKPEEIVFLAYLVMFSLVLIWLPFGLVLQAFFTPMMMRSALEQDFLKGLSLGFAWQFVRNTWRESIVATGLVYLTMLAAMAIGSAIFCIGQYFTLGLVLLVQVHFFDQLYRLHCRRGGQPIMIVD